ncbi:MAG TPA: hypothetical protein DD473_04700 [Planctomycetaceae bacterium]|nr:hypothetical protein [Planctomycetaceae bacterium]|tara:strand:- start:525 stop:743 length:219 start_codon:yes stop_codon:yes gene_type:complete
MSIDVEELKSLSSVEKIELIGILWDDLDPQSIPISESTINEATRRYEELSESGRSVEESTMWDRLDKKVTEG